VESALADIRDAEHDSSDGLHVAALAGTWLALVCGFGGLRHVYGGNHHSGPGYGGLSFRPVLPDELPRLRFRLLFRGRLLRVTVERQEATYELLRGESLTVRHEDDDVQLTVGGPVTRPTVPRPRPALPRQPGTRAPGRGTLQDDSRPATPASAGHRQQA
jgi:alpha,alpha-trehalose phosphorylase